jgi:hypothetical protein
MILTPLNIQLAIIKAFYALAKKSVKYYAGLAFGKNNTCLFKEIRLLRAYVEILKNFEIVGSKTTCCCEISGDYTFLFNNDQPGNITQLQLACDNTGTLVYNNNTYNVAYYYDANNQKLVATINDFTEEPNDVILTFDNAVFDSSCNVTLSETSPFIYSEIDDISIPSTFFGGSIILFDDEDNPFNVFSYESDVTGNYVEISNLWNEQYSNEGWYLSYTNDKFVMSAPLGTTSDYKFNFYQSEGDFVPATTTIADPFEYGFIPAVIQGNVLFNDIFVPFVTVPTPANTVLDDLFVSPFLTAPVAADTILQIPTAQFPSIGGTILIRDTFFNPIYQAIGATFTSIDELVDDFNLNIYGYVAEIQGTLGPDTYIKFTAPEGTGWIYNGIGLEYNNYGAGYLTSNSYVNGKDITEGSMAVNLYDASSTYIATLYSDDTLVNYTDIQNIIDNFNDSLTNQEFICSIDGLNGLEFTAATDINYNDWKIEFIYSYNSDQYTDINTLSPVFAGAIDTTEGSFNVTFYNPADEFVATLYSDETLVNYSDINEIISNYNTSTTTQGVTIASNGSLGLEFFPPADPDYNYNNWQIGVVYSYNSDQYPDVNIISPFTGGIDRTNGNLLVTLLSPFNVYQNTLYQDDVLVNYTSLQEVVDVINNSPTNLGFSCEVAGDNILFISPENTGYLYNDWKINFNYFYESDQYTDFEEISTFENGVSPQAVEYSSVFDQTSEITEFTTDNPCVSTTIEQSCLSNNQISKIIQHINKLVR